MIELWSWPTPNGQKVHILLEETGLPYKVMPMDADAAPKKRITAIIDPASAHGPIKLSEPGAILFYLAEKAGNFIPTDPASRYLCLQWTMFQISGLGPAFQHYRYFSHTAPEKSPLAIKRFKKVIQRLAGVLERRLAEDDALAGTYSIADMAVYPSIAAAAAQAINLDAYPAIKRWADKMAARPAVARGMALMQ
jgi:GSH-dependent disulfide-bond oxidoreductase